MCKDQSYENATKWYTNDGNASAQNNLGALYTYGHGVSQNYKKASTWHAKAAEQRDASAQYNLGATFKTMS